MEQDKYAAQKKHLRAHYVRLSLDLRPEELERFKRVCAAQGTKPTTEIKRFIRGFCDTYEQDEQQEVIE